MSDITAEQRREIGALRSLMITPGNVQLSRSGKRTWLTDQIVLLDVTGLSVIAGLEDGWYRIVGGGQNPGLTVRSDTSKHLLFNVDAYLEKARKLDYYPVQPTEWSLTNNEAKAFLLYVTVRSVIEYTAVERIPLAMNQDVWKAFRLEYPDAELYHTGYGRPFLVSTPDNPELAYVESIAIPEKRQPEAMLIADAYSGQPDTVQMP